MREFLKWLRWTLLGTALLLALGIAAAVIYTQTESFRRMLEERALAAINGSINGVISWDRIEGSLWSNLRIYDLRLRYRERDVFRTARAEMGYSLLPLLWGQVQITTLTAAKPWLELRKDDDGDWTIVEALATGEPSAEANQWVFSIDGLTIIGGELIVEPVAAKPEVHRVRDLNLTGSVRIAGDLDATVGRLGAWIDVQGAPQVYAQGTLTYRQNADSESLALEKFWLQTPQSRIMLAGSVENFATLKTNLQITIGRLAAADIARFIAVWPADKDVRGDVSARGTGDALDNRFKLIVDGAELTGTLSADVLSESKPYSGGIAVRGLNLATMLPGKELAGTLDGDFKVAGSAADFESTSVSGKVRISSAVISHVDLGQIALVGGLKQKVATMNGELRGSTGEASWRGRLVLGTPPEYRIELAARSLDAVRILQLNQSVPGNLSFTGTVEGAGFDLATMNTRANIDVTQSQAGAVTIENGKLRARIAQGRIHLQELRLQATGAGLAAHGELGINLHQPGRLVYQLELTNLTPWLELFEHKGSGRLNLTGTATGNLARLQTRGAMKLRALDTPEVAVQQGRMDFVVERQSGVMLPAGNIDVDLHGARAGVQLARLQAAIKLPSFGTRVIGISASARDQAGREHSLIAEVEKQPETLITRARELNLALPGGTWSLAGPATVTRAEDHYVIDRLILRNRTQMLTVSGAFSPNGAQSLDASVDRLSLATLYGFFSEAPDVTGNLSARAQIRGTAAAPAIQITAELADSKIAGQAYRGMRGLTRYENQSALVDLVIEQDESHNLQVRGTIPLALSWEGGWRAEPLKGMDLRARSAGLSLAFLNAFKPAAVQNIGGVIALDMALRGTWRAPEPSGTFALRDGAFEAKALGTKISAVAVEGSADAQRINLTRLAARSGEGSLGGTGVISLRQFVPENVKLALKARRWPAINTQQYRAQINANINVAGPIDALRIAGDVQVDEGSIRPALNFLERGPVSLTRDPTITVVQRRGEKPIAEQSSGEAGAENSDLLKHLVLDIAVTIPNNFWIRHPNATVELSGKLNVIKKPETDLSVNGLVQVVRGSAGFQGRKFTLTEGRIEFTGGKPANATLKVVAEYRVDNYLVNVVVSGTAEKPSLALQSTPALEQSDILSLLLFGKPVADLTSNQQTSLQQNAINLSAGFAATTIGRAVSNALGLQNLGIDLSDISYTGGQVRFGRYVGERTYLSVSQEIAGQLGQEVTVEYQLTPDWRVGATTATERGSGVDVIWHKRY